MKTYIFIFIILFFYTLSNISQEWERVNLPTTGNNPFRGAMNGGITYINADTGFVFNAKYDYRTDPVQIYRTTNKGLNWSLLSEITVEGNDPFDRYHSYNALSFINSNTGWLSFAVDAFDDKAFIYKTTDKGNTWNKIYEETGWINNSMFGALTFVDANTGFLRKGNIIYKTSNGGTSWTNILSTAAPLYITDFRIFNNVIYIAGVRFGTNISYPYLVKSNNFGSTFNTIFDGFSGNTGGIQSLSLTKDNNNQDVIKCACDQGMYILNSNNTFTYLSDPLPNQTYGFLAFNNSNYGTVAGYSTSVNDLIYTSNQGYNWTNVPNYSGGDVVNILNMGDIVNAVTRYEGGSNRLYTRKLNINFNTNFDWRQNGYSGTIFMDNLDNGGIRTFNTSISNQYLRGGSAYISVPDWEIYRNDSASRFYYWGGDNGNLSLNPTGNKFYYIKDGSINADYKTKLLSTTENALRNANQVKAIKDTNGVTNLIYESMGGIFFTRTKPDGQFKAEEILSSTAYFPNHGYATFNNKNPFLSEVKNTNNTETNMWACWERREGNNIKIMGSARVYDYFFPDGLKHYWGSNELLTLNNVPQEFECMPKIFVAGSGANPLRVLTYLKPDGNNKKIVGRVYTTNSIVQEFDITLPGNIAEYGVAAIYPFYGITFQLHIAYRKDQTVYYKSVKIGQLSTMNGTYADYGVVDQDIAVSNDNSRWRASLDISLKNSANSTSTFNMQPVITYQGRYDVRVMIENEDGPPIEQAGAYYPIYVKERLSGGTWSSSNISYNSSVNTVQMTPNIEGSKHMNSCILDYARGSSAPYTFNKVVPRWNGVLNSGYGCSPTAYSGTDAKFIKGGLINNSSTSHKLMTLSLPGNNVYTVGTQNFTITNGIEGDGNFDAISGSVEDNDVKYTFNLGNILVNSSNIGFLPDIDTAIDNSGELNSNMVSETFNLNENDTLIIGRNAAYVLNDPNGAPAELEYWVKLMNKSTNSMHRLLAHDTIHTADSVIYEFLEGYIIRNIPNGTDSFYVQLEIDTVDGNFGIGGGLGGDGDGGDNIQLKKKIYWENEKLSGIVNNIPKEFNLYQNFPNPFNPATVIKYDLPKNVKVTVKIYDLLGREVTALVNNEFKNAGRYELNWNAGNYASGVYIYRIEAGDFVSTKKMILVK